MKKTIDTLMARGIDRLSAACVKSRLVGDFVIGEEPRRWRVSPTPSADVTNWIESPGYAQSGNRPATYRRFVQMETDAAALQEQAERDWPNKVPAVAFAVGSALVTADLSIKEINEMRELAATDGNGGLLPNLAVTMGVGREMLRSTIGTRGIYTNVFIEAEAPITVSEPLDFPAGQHVRLADIEQQFPNAHHF